MWITKTANIATGILVVVHIAYKCQHATQLKIPVLIFATTTTITTATDVMD